MRALLELARRARRQHRQAGLVLPDRAPRPLGHGPAVPADPGRPADGERHRPRHPPAGQDRQPLRARPPHRPARSCRRPSAPCRKARRRGDHVAPTQPFSELTFRPEQNLTGADMWGATIFDQLACRILFHQLRYEGTFTPPSVQGTLVFPGNLGMFEWGGIARRSGPPDRDRQPDGDPLRLEAHAARPGQPGGAQRRAPARQRGRRAADVRRALRRRAAPVPVAARPALHAAALGLHGRDRSEDEEDRLDAQERHHPRRGAAAAPVQDGRAEPGRPDDDRRRRRVPDLDAGLLHPRLRRDRRRRSSGRTACRPAASRRR